MKNILSGMPLIGTLWVVERRHIKDALEEVFFTQLIALAPVWLAVVFIAASVDRASSEKSFYFLYGMPIIGKGELMLYSLSMVAPTIYMASRDKYKKVFFPHRTAILLCTIVVALLAACLFGADRAKTEFNELFVLISAILFAVAFFLLFMTTVYNNNVEGDPAKLYRDKEGDFSKGFDSHRG